VSDTSATQTITEIQEELPPGWVWRPRVFEHGEAQRLLRRYTSIDDAIRAEILESASDILGRCAPADADSTSKRTGLVVGYVQSGKTLSFTTLTALACDNNFPLIIVLSGTKRNLYDQTVKRLRSDLDLNLPGGRWVLFEAQTANPLLAQQLRPLLSQWDSPEQPGFPRRTAIIAVLKNRSRVDGLISALEEVNLNGRPCLIIDDEADQHGLNTQVAKGQMSAVYNALLNLRATIPEHTYLQYTATPQAPLLLRVMDRMSPHFGCVLSAGVGYTGGEAFFGPNAPDCVRIIPEDERSDVDDDDEDTPPQSLLDALGLFYLGVAIQAHHRGHMQPTQIYRSMLVHPSMHTIEHWRYRKWIEAIQLSWVELLSLDESDGDRIELLKHFEHAYQDLDSTVSRVGVENANHENVPPFDELVPLLPNSIGTTRIWEVNSRILDEWKQDNWVAAHSHILVGGENLGRGFTVEGLTVTYMPRGRGAGVADTIQQRGRFFGYKKDYLGLCRVFLPRSVRSDYENYIEHETYVMDELKALSRLGSPMIDWRRRMLLAHSLRPTRRSVIPPDVYEHLRVSEWTSQMYPWTPDNDIDVDSNWTVLEGFLEDLAFTEDAGSPRRTVEQRHSVAREVSLARVLQELLIPLQLQRKDAPGFSAVELAIQLHLSSHPYATADVYCMAAQRSRLSGGGLRRRQLNSDGRVVNLFQGEAPVSPREERGTIYPGDRNIHSRTRLSVQIHDLDLTESSPDHNLLRGHVPALSIWIPAPMRIDIFEESAQ
jgi:hypothetical protein